MVEAAVFYAAGPVFVIASLAMPAGIGGGLLYVPLLVIMGVVLEARRAAALGQPLICGATLAAVAYNVAWQRRHPEKRLVQTEIALAAIPACLAGAMAGAVLNQVLPDALIHGLLLVVLLTTLRKTAHKAVAMWRQESSNKAAAPLAEPAPDLVGAAVEDGAAVQSAMASSDAASNNGSLGPGGEDTPHSAFSAFPSQSDEATLAEDPASAEGVRRRGTASAAAPAGAESVAPAPGAAGAPSPAPVPQPAAAVAAAGEGGGEAPPRGLRDWLFLLAIWSLLVLSLVLRGGKGAGSLIGVSYCSWEYWLITGIAFASLLIVEVVTRRADVPAHVCFLVGCISAVVGMGGGVVLNPMLLGANFEPLVVTATVTVMIVMVSSSATMNFVMVGAVPVVPTLVLFSATFLGSFCGKSVVGWVVAKTGRNSFVVFLLVGFIAVSSVVVAIQGVMSVVSSVSRGENPLLQWSGPCE